MKAEPNSEKPLVETAIKLMLIAIPDKEDTLREFAKTIYAVGYYDGLLDGITGKRIQPEASLEVRP